MSKTSLTFVDKPADWKGAALIGHVPAVPDKKALLAALERALGMPARNWDALEESLREFSWAKGAKSIALVHAALPALPPDDLRTYLEILSEAIAALRGATDAPPALHAVFPTAARARVEALLRG